MSATLTSNTLTHSYEDNLDYGNLMTKSSSSSSCSPSTDNQPSTVSSENSLSSVKLKHKALNDICKESSQPLEQHNTFLLCNICNKKLSEPKLLNCLHAFCRLCLVVKTTNECGDIQPLAIDCTKCNQETIINGPNGVDSLDDDYVMQNLLDMIAIEEMILDCTSCKTDEKAVARCADCAQFLCPNCVSAHQYMRCFENHNVVKFQEIINSFKKLNETDRRNVDRRTSCSSNSSSSTCSFSSNENLNDDLKVVPIHKPLFCKSHSKESLKFFCNTCQEPICTECVVSLHQQPFHSYERITDAEPKSIDELECLIRKTKDKINECQGDFQLLDQYLADLEEQKEQSRGLIEETFQSYRTILERRKDEMLKELEENHSVKEMAIMDLNQSVHSSIDQLYDSIKFVERVLKNGNCSEILLLKGLIVNQIRLLTNNIPLTDNVDVNLKFLTDEKRFEKAITDSFGRFQTLKEIKQTYLNNLTSSTSQNESLMLSNKSHINNGEQQRFQQIQNIQNIQKQIELQQQHQFIKPATQFQSNMEQEWLMMNMLNSNQFSKQNGMHQFETPADLQTSPNDDWTIINGNNNKYVQQTQQHQRTSLSPQSISSTSSNPWLNSALPVKGLTQQQIILNNLNNMQTNHNYLNTNLQKQQVRTNSPLLIENNMILTNASTSLQQHQLFLQQQQQMNSRCQTPSLYKANQVANELQLMQNINTVNNQLVVNGLDEYMPFGTNNMTQNFNQLSKLITNQQTTTTTTTNLTDIAALNMNLNELTSTNQNGFKASDDQSNSSQSPSLGAIGSSSCGNQFAGNGNLNPPVRQNCKMANMQIRTKFGMLGSGKAQFNSPHGFCLGADEEIIVADTNNHRIQIFDKKGEFKYCFGSPGRDEGQLWYPRKVTVMRDSGKFVVCDRGSERSRMQIFSKSGHFIKKIAIRYIDIVAGLAITQNGDIVAVDSVSPTVFRISENGELIKWFDCSDHMREPSDIAISGNEYFVCDFKGHCVCVFNEEGTFMRRIGGENVTNFPNGIDVSDAGDVLVGDSHGNRFHVAVFSREGLMLSEFECPYVKVSRCCGLKITSEGFVVTLAKNNHHVLVLDTLYVN